MLRNVAVNMTNNLLKTGEFARLARTTRRTIHWYEKEQILLPKETDESGCRYYKPQQIIDFQVILLLRKLGLTLNEIRLYLSKNKSLRELFLVQQKNVVEEIKRLQNNLGSIKSYYKNLEKNKLLVDPTIKKITPFSIFYIDKVGKYSEIGQYCLELKSYFKKLPKSVQFIALFFDDGFYPKRSKIRVGIIVNLYTNLKSGMEAKVGKYTLPFHKALSQKHKGSPALISLIWQELIRYRSKRNISWDTRVPFYEIYKKTELNGFEDEGEMISELIMPIS